MSNSYNNHNSTNRVRPMANSVQPKSGQSVGSGNYVPRTLTSTDKPIPGLVHTSVKNPEPKTKLETTVDEDIVVVKQITEPIVKSTTQLSVKHEFKCVRCGNSHRFSPYNVTVGACKIVLTVPNLPVLTVDEKSGKYIVCPIKHIQEKINSNDYVSISSEMIKENNYPPNLIFVWSNSVNEFNSDNGLINLLVKNRNKINNRTLTLLVKTIFCPDWWDEFLTIIASTPFDSETLVDSIGISIAYFDYIMSNFDEIMPDATNKEFDKCLKDYHFPKRTAILRTLRERQKRINEAQSQRQAEQLKIEKDAKSIQRIHNEHKRMEEMQQKELDEGNSTVKSLSLIEQFKNDLISKKKGHTNKFLAAINPDNIIIADLVMKSGEKSKLQSGVDSEDRVHKVKVWEYYMRQEKEIKEGIAKYKKAEWKKKESTESTIIEIPEYPTDPKKPKTLMFLSDTHKRIYEQNYLDYQKEQEKSTTVKTNAFVLDPWQSDAIEHIRNHRSVLITGPTSGGKTYVMMKGLDNIINTDTKKNLVYISPTFHLAYQTYANIKATFPRRTVAIITTEIICIPLSANIFIGTASELLNYFVTTSKEFHIGIFDEIHVASKLYCDDDNMTDVVRARAYANLLSRCKEQIIAASATINNEIEMRNFIVSQANICRTAENHLIVKKSDHEESIDERKIPKDRKMWLVEYTVRAIPLNEYRYVDNMTITEIDRSIHTVNTESTIDMSPSKLFNLLVQMRKRDMLPSITFELTDDIAWKSYVDLIDYIEVMESAEYAHYTDMIDKLNDIADAFNIDRDATLATIPEDDNFDSTRIRNGVKGNSKRESGIRSIKSKRSKAYSVMVNDAKTAIYRSIENYNDKPWKSLCELTMDDIQSEDIELFKTVLNMSKSKLSKIKITQSHIDMLQIIQKILAMDPDQNEMIYPFKLDKGSYYRFINSSCGMDQLKAIREPGSNEDSWKLRKRMIILAEAQRIHPKDIDGIIDIIMRGLEYGITIINPSLPFVIQHIILDNLRTKNMGVVFASESMTMGINYALRSVIIKSPSNCLNGVSINPGKLIQMGGRCGRRGKDTQAHVIYWGIQNDVQAEQASILPLTSESFLTDSLNTSSSIITDCVELAVELGAIHMFEYFEEEKKKPIMPASCTRNGGRVKDNRFDKNDSNCDSDEDEERKKCEDRSKSVQLKRSKYIDPTIRTLGKYCQFNSTDINELSQMICKINDDIIMDSFSIDSFRKSRNINIFMHMLIELHNRFSMSPNLKFLGFLEEMTHILQECEYRLIKLAK
jgi:hypothetical protein